MSHPDFTRSLLLWRLFFTQHTIPKVAGAALRNNEEMLSIVAGEWFFNQVQKNSPHTESQSCNESMKSASFEKRWHSFQCSFSLKQRLFRDGMALRGLLGFICSDAVRGVHRQRSVMVSLLSLVLWLPDAEVCAVLLRCRNSPLSFYTSDITLFFSSASSLLQKHQGHKDFMQK